MRLGIDVGNPLTLSLDDLTRWLGGPQWAPNTRKSARSALRAFYAWAVLTGRLESSPAERLPAVKMPRRRPRPASEDALAGALLAADERVVLAVRLAAYCGLRVGEVSRVRVDDVVEDLDGRSLRVIGKGGHERYVPLPDDLADDVVAAGERPDVQAVGGWVFPSGSLKGPGHLTANHLARLVNHALPDGVTVHMLRHRCATVAYAHTRDLRAVQELLGHARPETTASYVGVPTGGIRAAMAAAAAA